MLAEDQVDIFVLGDVNEAELVPLFKQLPFTPREEGKAAIFYNQPIRNVIEERTEREVLAQSKLNLAYNTDIYYGDSYILRCKCLMEFLAVSRILNYL